MDLPQLKRFLVKNARGDECVGGVVGEFMGVFGGVLGIWGGYDSFR